MHTPPPRRLGDRVHAPSHTQPHSFFIETLKCVKFAVGERELTCTYVLVMVMYECTAFFSVPAIVNRLKQEGISVLFPTCFHSFIAWAISESMVPLSFLSLTLLLLYLSVLQRLCESVSYENMCKCCWFKDKSKRWYPVKNTCPLILPVLTSFSPSISVSES